MNFAIVLICNTLFLETVTLFVWTHINYTWPSISEYSKAVKTGKYIPENNYITGLAYYKDYWYLSSHCFLDGVPVVLSRIPVNSPQKKNVLLSPYPSWHMNTGATCSAFQSITSAVVDLQGILWVLDIVPPNNFKCRPRIVLLDLNSNGKVVHSYTFPDEICLKKGGTLNNLVLDGDYAYIVDGSEIDVGLIVYSRIDDKAWKLRDSSMYGEQDARRYYLDGTLIDYQLDLGGVALSPIDDKERMLFYCAFSSFKLYSIPVWAIRNETLSKSNSWRDQIKIVGKKSSVGDGMMMDNNGDMYYALAASYAVGKWNIYEPFKETVYKFDKKEFVWPDGFAIDGHNNLNVLTDGLMKVMGGYKATMGDKVRFKIWTLQTGYPDYMHSRNLP